MKAHTQKKKNPEQNQLCIFYDINNPPSNLYF